jgi:hypothetical protein
MDFETRGLARFAEPVARLLVLGAQRQPPHPAFGRRRISRFVIKPSRRSIWVWAIWSGLFRKFRSGAHSRVFNDAPAAARQ